MKATQRIRWKPADYNPNILSGMDARSVADFELNHSPFNERFNSEKPKPSVEFAHQFEANYQKAENALRDADPKGRVTNIFKTPPFAPKLMMTLGAEAADTLGVSKFGGAPDIRRILVFLINHHRRMKKERSSIEPRSDADILRSLWPRDCEGAPMMFVAQITMPPSVHMAWDYFARERISEWDDYDAPFSGFHRGSLWETTRSFSFFRSATAPLYDPRMDCGFIDESWFDRSPDEEHLMSEEEYLSNLTEAIPPSCHSHWDDEATRWSAASRAVKEMKIGFDLDMVFQDEWAGAPRKPMNLDVWKIKSSWREAFDERNGADLTLFGSPASQQTERRFLDPNSYGRPKAMRPWLNYWDSSHDFTWQMCFCQKSMEGFVHWGKADGSCT